MKFLVVIACLCVLSVHGYAETNLLGHLLGGQGGGAGGRDADSSEEERDRGDSGMGDLMEKALPLLFGMMLGGRGNGGGQGQTSFIPYPIQSGGFGGGYNQMRQGYEKKEGDDKKPMFTFQEFVHMSRAVETVNEYHEAEEHFKAAMHGACLFTSITLEQAKEHGWSMYNRTTDEGAMEEGERFMAMEYPQQVEAMMKLLTEDNGILFFEYFHRSVAYACYQGMKYQKASDELQEIKEYFNSK